MLFSKLETSTLHKWFLAHILPTKNGSLASEIYREVGWRVDPGGCGSNM